LHRWLSPPKHLLYKLYQRNKRERNSTQVQPKSLSLSLSLFLVLFYLSLSTVTVPSPTMHTMEHQTTDYRTLFIEDTDFYNSILLGTLLPQFLWVPLPRFFQTWLRNYIGGLLLYFISGFVWSFYIYCWKRNVYLPKGETFFIIIFVFFFLFLYWSFELDFSFLFEFHMGFAFFLFK